jgi:NAD(P)-dependent dehydrogenase (short-subunit alcohol dehydrogenase family)
VPSPPFRPLIGASRRARSAAPAARVAIRESGDLDEAARANIPLRSFGNSRDIAEAVCFLASDRARYVSAQTLNVDGGYAA